MPNIRHAFICTELDGTDDALVRPSNWNANLQYVDANGVPSGEDASVRLIATGDVHLYVSTTGSDVTGDGTVSNPFATPQGAYSNAAANRDFAGNSLTIHVGDGTYVANQPTPLGYNAVLDTTAKPLVACHRIEIRGDEAATAGSPASTVYFDCQGGVAVSHNSGAILYVVNIKFGSTSGCGTCIACGQAGIVVLYGVNLSTMVGGGNHLNAASHGQIATFGDTFLNITGNATRLAYLETCGVLDLESTDVRVTGTTYSDAGIHALGGGIAYNLFNTFTGTWTGRSYNIRAGGLLVEQDGQVLPGVSAGLVNAGGVYWHIDSGDAAAVNGVRFLHGAAGGGAVSIESDFLDIYNPNGGATGQARSSTATDHACPC